MPQFRSFRLDVADASVDVTEEYVSDISPVSQPLTPAPIHSEFPVYRPITTDSLHSASQPFYNSYTTRPLTSALQPTLFPPKKTDQLIVIPGGMKRTRVLPETTPPLRMRRRTRHGIALGTILFVLILTMISLAPLDGGQSTIHIFNNVVKWANAQQQNWNIAAHTSLVPDSSLTQNYSSTSSVSAPPISLPTSQYIAIARQDAIDAGISPDYFVRQINAESGFNPGAVSPASAVGIAQFEPSTAAGLGINPYDPVQALRAAAQLMASYNNQYGGDYAKALAAYNAGGGNLAHAVNICGANWLSCMPAETQNYVYKIMGV